MNDNNKVKNPYEDYLPRNRIERENGKVASKIAKYGIIPFYVLIIAVIGVGISWFTGNYVFATKPRNYNMNMDETIDLDIVYTSKDVEWVSNSDNVIVENNVAIATGSGEAYLYAKEGNVQVSDVKLNVLTGDESISLDNHSIFAKVGDKESITVNINNNAPKKEEKESPKDKVIEFIKDIYHKVFPDDNNQVDDIEDNKDIENNNSDSNNNDNNSSSNNDDNNIDIDDDYDYDGDYYEGDDEQELEYISSDESIATVDDEGNITTISPGVVEITVRDEDGNEDYVVVTVAQDDIILYNEEYTLHENDNILVEYSLSSNTYTDEDIKWSSEDDNIAVVDYDGNVTAVSIGSTNIIVSVGDVEKKIKINVERDIVLPTDIKVSSVSVGIMVGDSQTINAEVVPDDSTDNTLTWTSGDSNIATVNDGKIIGKSAGETIIYVTTSNGIKKEINVTVTKKVILPESISLVDSEMDMTVGEVKKIEYTLNPSNATDKNIEISYDKNYLNVDEELNITALKSGNTVLIIKTSNDKTESMTINIKEGIVSFKSIKLSENNLTIKLGDTSKLSLFFDSENATNKEVTWTSSDTKIATVDKDGNVKGISEGTAIITVTSNSDSSIMASCKVTVSKVVTEVKVTLIKLSKNTLNLDVGASSKLGITVSPDNATNKNVTWTSSDTKIANVDNNGNVKGISEGTAIITVTSNSDSSIKASCIVTVSNNTYTIKFDGNGGSGSTKDVICMYDRDCTLSINTFSRTGYSFVGWSTTKDGKKVYNDKTSVKNLAKSGTVVLYAVWEVKKIKITFMRNYDVNDKTVFKTETFTYGAKGNREDGTKQLDGKIPTRDGYKFLGWSSTQNSTTGEYNKSNGISDNWINKYSPNITWYAIWAPSTYTITYNSNGGNACSPTTKTVTYGGTYGVSCTPTKAGYTFTGWYTAATGGTNIKDTTKVNITSNQTLYAHWTVNILSICFYPNGGTLNSGYSYDSTKCGGSGVLQTVKYNNSTISSFNMYNVTTLFSRTGYHVSSETKAWRKDSASSTTYINQVNQDLRSFISSGDKTIKLYANWAPKTITVTFHKNDGGTSVFKQIFTYGVSGNRFYYKNDGTPKGALTGQFGQWDRTGYTLLGWSKTSTATSKTYNVYSGVINNWIDTNSPSIDLYAVWSANTYTIKFNSNGGNGTTKDVSCKYGSNCILTSNGFSKSGYTFSGWAISASGNKLYNDKVNVKNLASSGSITLYAVWIKDEYVPKPNISNLKLYATRTLYAVGGSSKGSQQKVQQFAITDIGKDNEIIWYAYQVYANDNAATHISAYNKSNKRVYAAYIKNGGEGQSFDVVKKSNDVYTIYTGASAVNDSGTGRPMSVYRYDVTIGSKYNNTYDTLDFKNRGFSIGRNHEASYDPDTKLLSIKTGSYNVKIYSYDDSKALSSSNLSLKYSFNMTKRTSGVNGSDLNGNYIYYVDGMSDFYVSCYEITAGKQVYSVSLTNVMNKVKSVCSQCTGSNGEIEGIKIYNYKGKNRVFIGYKGGSYRNSAILYFDY